MRKVKNKGAQPMADKQLSVNESENNGEKVLENAGNEITVDTQEDESNKQMTENINTIVHTEDDDDVKALEDHLKEADVNNVEENGDGQNKADDNKKDKNKTNKESSTQGKKRKKRYRNKRTRQGSNQKAVIEDGDKKDFAGAIFMCNSRTKEDCFRYHVFGLPKQFTSLVQKVKKGMRLFLFDFDLRLMYGLYSARSNGGTNLVQSAFKGEKRAFPAQVKFRIHKDCLPLPEEKFKAAIKDNYYAKNKFKLELSKEQVKKLVNLFKPIPRGRKDSMRSRDIVRPERRARQPLEIVAPMEARHVPLPPAYAQQAELSEREYVPQIITRPDDLYAVDAYSSAYRRPIGDFPLTRGGLDPLPPVRNEFLQPSRSALSNVTDAELEYEYNQRLRERALLEKQAYPDEVRRDSYVPTRESDIVDRYSWNALSSTGSGYSYLPTRY